MDWYSDSRDGADVERILVLYRLEIVAGRRGIQEDIIWQMFSRLTPCSQTPLTTTYACTSEVDLPGATKQIMQGWIEEGDILAFVCEEVE